MDTYTDAYTAISYSYAIFLLNAETFIVNQKNRENPTLRSVFKLREISDTVDPEEGHKARV
jgi:hypothetical protein